MCVLIVELDAKPLLLSSWLDLVLCTNPIPSPWLLARRRELEVRLLRLYCLCCCAAPVCYRLCDNAHATHTYLVRTEARKHTHTHRSTVYGAVARGESSWRGCCCTSTATSTESGESCVMQQHGSSSSRARKTLRHVAELECRLTNS